MIPEDERHPLFDDDADPLWVERLWQRDDGQVMRGSPQVWDCKRCGALVLDRVQHIDWHGSVDSNTTAEVRR